MFTVSEDLNCSVATYFDDLYINVTRML